MLFHTFDGNLKYIYNSHPSCAKFSLKKKPAGKQTNNQRFLRIKKRQVNLEKSGGQNAQGAWKPATKKRQQLWLSADVVWFPSLVFPTGRMGSPVTLDLGHGWKGKTHKPESFILDLGSNHWFFFTTYSQSWDDPPKWLTLHFDP